MGGRGRIDGNLLEMLLMWPEGLWARTRKTGQTMLNLASLANFKINHVKNKKLKGCWSRTLLGLRLFVCCLLEKVAS